MHHDFDSLSNLPASSSNTHLVKLEKDNNDDLNREIVDFHKSDHLIHSSYLPTTTRDGNNPHPHHNSAPYSNENNCNNTTIEANGGCERKEEMPLQKKEDDDPLRTSNIFIDDADDEPQQQNHQATENTISNQHHQIIDESPGILYSSLNNHLIESNYINSRVVASSSHQHHHHFPDPINGDDTIFQDVDLNNEHQHHPTTGTQVLFNTSNPPVDFAADSTGGPISIQTTSPYSKHNHPQASPSPSLNNHNNNRRPSLDQQAPPYIPSLQNGTHNENNSVFRPVHQQHVIHIIEDHSGEIASTVEKRFSSAVVVSVALFFIGLPCLSCFPFLPLFPYRHSNNARVRSLGHISVVVFNILCVLNLCMMVCFSLPILFVLIVNAIVFSSGRD